MFNNIEFEFVELLKIVFIELGAKLVSGWLCVMMYSTLKYQLAKTANMFAIKISWENLHIVSEELDKINIVYHTLFTRRQSAFKYAVPNKNGSLCQIFHEEQMSFLKVRCP